MRKLIVTLLVLSLSLCCAPGLAEGAPEAVEKTDTDLRNAPEISPGDAESADGATDAVVVENDLGEYRVVVCDREGNPVEGAVIQFCDDVVCAYQTTDADGVAAFSVEEQKVYVVHVLVAPEGFAPDEGEYRTLDTYCDLNLFLEKAE